MLTPHLEKLILKGAASFSTFVCGGSQKVILPCPNDHYIIITDITYMNGVKSENNPMNDDNLKQMLETGNTQLKIFSSKSTNSFLFRPNYVLSTLRDGSYLVAPQGSVHHDVYLIHESDISFTFSNARLIDPTTIRIIQDPNIIAFPPPYDYGHNGQPGALATTEVAQIAGTTRNNDYVIPGGQHYAPLLTGASAPTEFIFPVDSSNYLSVNKNPLSYPIVHVNYVTIRGSLTNISATL